MNVETRRFTDGSVEAVVTRDDGQEVATLRVQTCKPFDGTLELHDVEFRVRSEDVGTLYQPGVGLFKRIHEQARVNCVPDGVKA